MTDRLRILLFVPPKIDAVATHHELSTRLAHGLAAFADADLQTSARNIDAATLSKYDLVHVFGCWNMASIQLLHKAYSHHVPTVCTPLGGLQPWVVRKHRASYAYKLQRSAIQKASAIHLCGQLELRTFSRLEWNKRLALIKNPVLTSQVSFDEMCGMMLKLYQKVVDSNARLLLSPTSTTVIGHLLQLGIDKEALRDQQHCDALRQQLGQLSTSDWRRMMLYADEELITEHIGKGLERMQFQAPELSLAEAERFPRNQNYDPHDLQADALCFQSDTLSAKLAASVKETETNERMTCVELLNFRHELEHHRVPLRHLANIYTSMRFRNMDEDRLLELVTLLGINVFAARLLSVLHHVLRLPEGFMPFAPREDHAARAMARDITKFNTW